jgi:4a-hydroxytetrahydrobiopterin dehydratase
MVLHNESCVPCQEGAPPLTVEELAALADELPGWHVKGGHDLQKRLVFADFLSAMAWLNSAAAVCEEQGHHADFKVGWGYVEVEIFTHKIDGLTRSDAVLAAKLDTIVHSDKQAGPMATTSSL